ncbi:MAG TPA: hypothetical protein VFI84_04440 [Candidatus Saccharimonadales bacterium]|nr:hypothetical protein [Candidatus Saccharimonadales bacterium]
MAIHAGIEGHQSELTIPSFEDWEKELQDYTVLPGDWANIVLYREISQPSVLLINNYVRRTLARRQTAHLLRGYVDITPASAEGSPIAISSADGRVIGHKNRYAAFCLSKVTLLEQDGEPCYEPQPDLILDPQTQKFKIFPIFEVPDDSLIPVIPSQPLSL